MVTKLQNAFLPNSVSQFRASVNAVSEKTPTSPRTQRSKKRESGGGSSTNSSKGKSSGKSSASPTYYGPNIQITTQQEVDEEDGEWEVSPSEYRKLCQRDDYRTILKRMRSDDVTAESNSVSTSSSVAASKSVVPRSDSSTQEWVPKRIRIVDTTMVDSFEADANSVTFSIPLEPTPDVGVKQCVLVTESYYDDEDYDESQQGSRHRRGV